MFKWWCSKIGWIPSENGDNVVSMSFHRLQRRLSVPLCKSKRQYLLTWKVSRYRLLALRDNAWWVCVYKACGLREGWGGGGVGVKASVRGLWWHWRDCWQERSPDRGDPDHPCPRRRPHSHSAWWHHLARRATCRGRRAPRWARHLATSSRVGGVCNNQKELTWGSGKQINIKYCGKRNSVNRKHLYSICTMLDQRWRRWAGVVQMLYKFWGFWEYVELTSI